MADQPIFYPVQRPVQDSPFDSFARAFLMGQHMLQQRQSMEMEKQDRALKIEALQQEAKRLKLEDKVRAFQLLQGQRGPMTEQEGPEIPALFSAGGQMGVPTTKQVEGQHPEIDFSEIQPGLRLRPQNLGDMLSIERAKRMREMEAKVAETAALEQTKANVARAPQTVNLPGQGEVSAPANLLPDILKQAAEMQARLQGQEFTAGQNALNRGAEDARSRRSSATTLEAARISSGNKGLSSEAASRLAIVKTADKLAEDLKKEFSGAGRLKLAGIYAGTNAKINRKIEDLVDASIRVRTGAAASKAEVKERSAQIIRAMDVASGNTKPIIEALQRMQDEARSVAGGIRPGSATTATDDPLGLFK